MKYLGGLFYQPECKYCKFKAFEVCVIYDGPTKRPFREKKSVVMTTGHTIKYRNSQQTQYEFPCPIFSLPDKTSKIE